MTESELIAVIEDAAREGSWNAAAWLAERRWPQRWAKSTRAPAKPKPTDKDENDADPFAEVIELRRAK